MMDREATKKGKNRTSRSAKPMSPYPVSETEFAKHSIRGWKV